MKCFEAVLVFAVGEAVGLFVFASVRATLGPAPGSPANEGATARGMLERLVVVTGLLAGFPHVITAFAALKLGTRLAQEQDSKITNNYFLVGNLISLLLAMLYAVVIRRMWAN